MIWPSSPFIAPPRPPSEDRRRAASGLPSGTRIGDRQKSAVSARPTCIAVRPANPMASVKLTAAAVSSAKWTKSRRLSASMLRPKFVVPRVSSSLQLWRKPRCRSMGSNVAHVTVDRSAGCYL